MLFLIGDGSWGYFGISGKSKETLGDLEERADDRGPRNEVLQRSRAYLQRDFVHGLEPAEKGERAKEIFREAAILWEDLLKSRPQSEEYREGLEWIRLRAGSV